MKKILILLVMLTAYRVMNANDLTIRFNRQATFFEETFVIGNGSQGAIIYGDPYCERLSLNDITLWSGEPDTAVYNRSAYSHLLGIREALDKGDYELAETLQRNMQGHNSQYYMSLGNLYINFADNEQVADYQRKLDIDRAVAEVTYSRAGNQLKTEYFASALDSVIIVNISAVRPISLSLSFKSLLPYEIVADRTGIAADGYAPYGFALTEKDGKKVEELLYDPDRGIHFRARIAAVTESGTIEITGDSISMNGAKDVTIYVSMATSFTNSSADPAHSTRDYRAIADTRCIEAMTRDVQDISERHIEDYGRLFSRVNLDLGESADSLRSMPTDERLKSYYDNHNYDPDLEELYFQFGRYLLISSSRTPGVPANLQGLWNEQFSAPWRSNYTININLEENYWPACVANLAELHMPLLSFVGRLPITGEQTAREYYDIHEGWCAAHNSDIWAMTCPVGHGLDQPQWANWNMGGAWLASHIWQHYLFTKDRAVLEEYYPVLRGAADFCLAWLVKDKDGNLITTPSTSPENRFVSPNGNPVATSAGCFADLAIIRECLTDARSAAAELERDSELIERIDSVLPNLAPYKIGAAGQLQEWAEDFREQDPQHRHQSHLYGLYPGNHITLDQTPDLARAAAKTLEIKGENTTGWSTGWRVNLLARLAEAEKAYSMYRRLLKYVSPDKYQGADKRRGGGTYPNLLDAHSPFQIDGNFGGTAGVAEMLIQSTPEKIVLLPALPDEWAVKGSFTGLCARGGFILNADWRDGRVTHFTIASPPGGSTTVIANGIENSISLIPGESVVIKCVD